MNMCTKLVPLALVANAALMTSATAQNTIKVGELNSYKVAPAFLDPYKRGIDLAIDEINAKGGHPRQEARVRDPRDDSAESG